MNVHEDLSARIKSTYLTLKTRRFPLPPCTSSEERERARQRVPLWLISDSNLCRWRDGVVSLMMSFCRAPRSKSFEWEEIKTTIEWCNCFFFVAVVLFVCVAMMYSRNVTDKSVTWEFSHHRLIKLEKWFILLVQYSELRTVIVVINSFEWQGNHMQVISIELVYSYGFQTKKLGLVKFAV